MKPKNPTNNKMQDGGDAPKKRRRRSSAIEETKKIEPTTGGYAIPEVEVTAQKPSFLRYQDRFEKQFPKSERVTQYLDPLARQTGSSETNYPGRIDREYDQDRKDYVARALMLDRSGENYSPREQDIINQSRYAGKSKEYAYRNPQKLPISGGDAAINALYQNDYLTQIPGARQVIQRLARNQISDSAISRGFKEEGIDDTKGSRSTDYSNSSFDPLAQFLGSNQGVEKSIYSPKDDYLGFLPSYSLKNRLGVSPKFKDITSRFVGNEQLKNSPIFDQGLETAPYGEQPDLGHFKSGAAWDNERNLPYYFVSDAWDFDPQDYATRYQSGEKGQQPQAAYKQAYLLQKAGNPYKIYDRFYFDPNTGDYIDDTKDPRFKTKKMGGKIKTNKYADGGKMKFKLKIKNIPFQAPGQVYDPFSKFEDPNPWTDEEFERMGFQRNRDLLPIYENGGGLSRSEDYGSKKKPYPSVPSSDFAGGGRSYPIPTRADAVDALRLASLHGRSDVKAAVYKKYPGLKKAEYGLKLMEGYHRMPDGSMMANSQMADTGANILNYAHMMEYGGNVQCVPILDGVKHLEMTPANQIAKSGIHIKKENRGKFTASAKHAGMGVQEYARHVLSDSNASPTQKKRANFARNAAKWHKGEYGLEIPINIGVPALDGIKRLEMANYGYAQNGYYDPYEDQPYAIDGDPVTSATPPGMEAIDLSQATDQLGYAPNEGPQWSVPEENPSPASVKAGNKMPNIHINAGAAIAGLAGLVTKAAKKAQATNEFARLKRKNLTMPTYNQNPYGTGSQAISRWGTTIGGKSYNFSPDQVKFLRTQGYKL